MLVEMSFMFVSQTWYIIAYLKRFIFLNLLIGVSRGA